MPRNPMDDEEVRRWSHHLRLWMTERGRSQRSVEREIGWGVGYLSQLLRPSPPDLKVKQLLAILRVLGVSSQAFFAGLYRDDEVEVEPRPMNRAELRHFVSQTLREELVRLGGGAESAPAERIPSAEEDEPRGGRKVSRRG